MVAVDVFESWLEDFSRMDNQEEKEVEAYIINSEITIKQSETQVRKKMKNLAKKGKKEKIATKSTQMIKKTHHDAWSLTECNVCRKCVAKTEEGGAEHRKGHDKHNLRCKKIKTCGSIYRRVNDLKIHQQLNPGH